MEFYKKVEKYRSAIPRRAAEMKRAAELEWSKERGLRIVDSSFVPLTADWGSCMSEAWKEFKDGSNWVDRQVAEHLTGYSRRELLRLTKARRIIAVKGLDGKWYYNIHSLNLFVASLPRLDPEKEYQTVEELAVVRGCTPRNIQIKIKKGQIPAVKVKGTFFIEVSA